MSEHEHSPHSRLAAIENAARQEMPDHGEILAWHESAASAQPSIRAIPVTGTPRAANGDETIYRMVWLNASAFKQLLPQDDQRYRAVVIAVDEPVVICGTQGQASDAANQGTYPAGFYLGTGIPLVIRSKGLAWVANTNGSTGTKVSVMVERYAEPEPDAHN